MKEVKNVDLVRLFPMVQSNAAVYEIEDDEMDRDYGDGRCKVFGIIYQMVCYRFSDDDIDYVGWVSEFDLKICKFESYKINDYCFPAENDEQAKRIVNDNERFVGQLKKSIGFDEDNNEVWENVE